MDSPTLMTSFLGWEEVVVRIESFVRIGSGVVNHLHKVGTRSLGNSPPPTEVSFVVAISGGSICGPGGVLAPQGPQPPKFFSKKKNKSLILFLYLSLQIFFLSIWPSHICKARSATGSIYGFSRFVHGFM